MKHISDMNDAELADYKRVSDMNDAELAYDLRPYAAPLRIKKACEDCQHTGWCHAFNKCDITGQPL